jgi:hypothetical protein
MRYKTIAAISVMVLCLSTPVLAKDKENKTFQFRGVEWGIPMTELISQVVENEYKNGLDEGGYDVEIDKIVIFDTTVGGYKCEADYFLVDGVFADGAYFLKEDHSNIEQYYKDYVDLVDKYTEKYGKPLYDSKEWIGDSVYKDKPEKYGMAVGLGELELSAGWEAEDGSAIQFSMTGDNFDITTRIDYLCPDYSNDTSSDEGI